ncbi:hypothetical protein FNF27_06957 [Cafeteria roenbergensis]|uniref:Splicing factor subunit n=1 Tax=Cafeteria roenbergensis TaxID=33653 RepID=A0A5A8DW25_CAFRO|nr:hypothetical protein FNF29_06907 [Cafeteria roenbergensis]KAA0151153.1 hypothetical protein FNF31_06887 [Cafeteria roenbergensis]KAA0156995.1 hypothetical protein FNF28_06562 [Cafeteria roenbergensis]KAA0169409.1 hypothetical protein FNF27_06957 [Cafeteria roenbergensis]|mmetsp:Transcript_23206/g.87851  ORF Transcript_23206/g.87851 Transcript_23206/m.87851 type:complete len:103 (-) Transcript_23206:90-398(-)|eukprot:KAA0148112.1 hypothetical protein FNF29_06907 [Cafeteria roenbergensis]
MAGASDRYNVNVSFSKNWDHLKSKFVGTGHPEMTRHELVTNHHRDSIASAVGHFDMLTYLSAGQNEAPGRVRFAMLDRMLQPCGPPPRADVEEAARRLGSTG